MNRVKNIVPHASLKSLYHTMIESYINYGITVWGNSPHANKILTLQKKAIRIINRKPFKAHTEPLFKSENILMLQDLYKMQVLIFMYDLQIGKLPRSFSDFAVMNRNYMDRITRQSDLFHTKRPRTTFSKNLPNHSFPRIWNSFHNDITTTKNRTSFKKECKIKMLNKYKDHIRCNNSFCRECNNT